MSWHESERRLELAARAEATEMMELWLRAMQPAWRILDHVHYEHFQQYFRYHFGAAVKALRNNNSDLLADILIEMMTVVDGHEEVTGVHPVTLEETLARIARPLSWSLALEEGNTSRPRHCNTY